MLGRLATVQLHSPQPDGVGDLDDPLRCLVAKDPERHDLGREAAHDVTDVPGRDLTRRRREHESDGVGPHGHTEKRVLLGGYAVDLHEHGVQTTGAYSW